VKKYQSCGFPRTDLADNVGINAPNIAAAKIIASSNTTRSPV